MKFGDENLSTNDNNTNAHLIKSTSRRLRRLVIVEKMRSAAVSPDSNLVNRQRKKSRDGREIAPSEARKHPRNFKTKMEEEEEGLPSSSSWSSGRCQGKRSEAKPLGVIVAGCEGEGEEESSVACLSHGFISVIGRRRVMEDAVTVAPGFVGDDEFGRCDFFAVYDGHGGAKVANACRDRMHQLVAEEVAKGRRGGGGVLGKGVEYWEKVMAASFERMDAEVSGGEGAGIGDQGDTLKTVGSTAVMVMVGKEEMVAANCGDSRAVLCTGGIAVPLSHDHKPDRPDERERVEAAGGRVIDWNGSRVLGVLATSRSIGDQYLKPFVISAPEVKVMERSELDDFLVIASDGLWDVVSSEFACEIVKKCFEGQIRMRFSEKLTGSYAAEAAALLAELALARGSKDNISVIVVELKKNGG